MPVLVTENAELAWVVGTSETEPRVALPDTFQEPIRTV